MVRGSQNTLNGLVRENRSSGCFQVTGKPFVLENAMKTTEERFWEKVDVCGDDECWNWKGCKTCSGYGAIGINYKVIRAHRYSWELHNGKLPDELDVLHHCDNPACVNPKHLWLGTQKDNNLDRDKKGRGNNGNQKGINNPHSKLKDSDVIIIRKLFVIGLTRKLIAEISGVNRKSVESIVSRKSWKHIS